MNLYSKIYGWSARGPEVFHLWDLQKWLVSVEPNQQIAGWMKRVARLVEPARPGRLNREPQAEQLACVNL